MRIASPTLLAATILACAPAPAPAPPSPPPALQPWEDLDRTCARDDHPRHLERLHVESERRRRDGQRRELLVVPVRVERALAVPRSWLATGSERPDIAPFRWHVTRVESAGVTSGHPIEVTLKHVSRDRLDLSLRVNTSSVSGLVAEATIERRPGGELVAALATDWFTDLPPWGGHWSDLAGELRLSTDRWDEPGERLDVHLEVASGVATVCGQFRLPVPPAGEGRRLSISTRPFRDRVLR